jgi:hypothetical protein
MKLPQTGGCICGAVRYEITEAPTSLLVAGFQPGQPDGT